MGLKSLAKLHEVEIGLGPSVPHFAATKFRSQTAHIAIMFGRYFREEYGYVLDGSHSIQIHFGMSEKIMAMYGKDYYFQDRNNWSCCGISKFDLASFTSLSDSEQDELTTGLVEKALSTVAKKVGADVKPIREIAKRLRADQFTAEFLIKRFVCHSPDGTLTARVWSHLARGSSRWRVEILDADDQVVREEWIPDSTYTHNDVTETALLAKWDQRGFSLRNDKGTARYLLDLGDLGAKRKRQTVRPKVGGDPKPPEG